MKTSLKIELIHPPHPEAIEDRLDPPLGLLYIAASIKNAGHIVRVNDMSGKPILPVCAADIYGITTYATSLANSRQIANSCRQANPNCKVVVGGAHPTAVPKTIDFADIVVIGEGELAFLDILADYPNNKKFYERPLERNLDLYANPDYGLVDIYSYKRTIDGERSLPILSTRGCPYRCAFCGLAKQHKVVKSRSPEKVAQEVEYLKDIYGITKFNFQDDSFTVNRRRLYKLLDLLEPLNIGFRCHGRVGADRPEDYKRLKDAGCDIIAWGIESGSQEILDRMNKNVTVEQNEQAIRWAKDAGITTRAFFIIGFPGETRQTLEETKQFIIRTYPDQYFVSNFVPYPGTDVWNNPAKYGITWMGRDFSNYFQIDATGYGGLNISTDRLDVLEFLELEKEFRVWLKSRKRRGYILDYEKRLESESYAESDILYTASEMGVVSLQG